MAKKKQMRTRVKERTSKSAGEQTQPADPSLNPDSVESTRAQRKVAKASRFLDKLQTTQSALALKNAGVSKKTKRKKARSEGPLKGLQAEEALGTALGSLAQSLGDALPTSDTLLGKKKVLTAKARQKLVLHETQQMSAVIHDPTFKADPFAAIHAHLQSRLPSLSAAPHAPPPTASVTMRAGTKSSKAGQGARAGKKKKGCGRTAMRE